MKLILWWTELWAWLASAFREEPEPPLMQLWTLDCCPCDLCRQHAEEDADDDRRDKAARAVRRQFTRTRRLGPASISPARRLELDAIARISLRKVH
jgi:hypothetical protein